MFWGGPIRCLYSLIEQLFCCTQELLVSIMILTAKSLNIGIASHPSPHVFWWCMVKVLGWSKIDIFSHWTITLLHLTKTKPQCLMCYPLTICILFSRGPISKSTGNAWPHVYNINSYQWTSWFSWFPCMKFYAINAYQEKKERHLIKTLVCFIEDSFC